MDGYFRLLICDLVLCHHVSGFLTVCLKHGLLHHFEASDAVDVL